MGPKEVKSVLLENPDRPKRIATKSGRRILVRGVEQWVTGPDTMIVLDGNGEYVWIPYHAIASIREIRSGRGRRFRRT